MKNWTLIIKKFCLGNYDKDVKSFWFREALKPTLKLTAAHLSRQYSWLSDLGWIPLSSRSISHTPSWFFLNGVTMNSAVLNGNGVELCRPTAALIHIAISVGRGSDAELSIACSRFAASFLLSSGRSASEKRLNGDLLYGLSWIPVVATEQISSLIYVLY